MTKPIGPICNLDCSYCFYLEKEKLFPKNEHYRMSDEVLRSYIRDYLKSQPGQEVTFAWQGGEPLLLGVEYFRKIIAIQSNEAGTRRIGNTLQTNATLINEEWARFFAENDFLLGVSLDGPKELHDTYRVDKQGGPSFERVMAGIDLLKKHRVRFNILTVVNRDNAKRPLEVYRFIKSTGSHYVQFIPLVERLANPKADALGLDFSPPPEMGEEASPVTEWSVDPHDFGDFLVTIFEEWVREDVGKISVGIFDEALGKWAGIKGGMCVFSETCGGAMAMEHNGDLYSCDHYVYPDYKLGNILESPLHELANSPAQQRFGQNKRDQLPTYCRNCEVLFACNGECPKHRFVKTPDGDPGLNYLCPAYKKFFNHINPAMQVMARLWQEGKPPALIMELMEEKDRTDQIERPSNDE